MESNHARVVLVVEDDQEIRDVVSDLLIFEGYGVAKAQDGQDAMSFLRSTERLPDVILLDLVMPRMDGYRFRAQQLKDPRISAIPVVVMTANQNPDLGSLFVSAFIRKPMKFEDLLAVIQRMI